MSQNSVQWRALVFAVQKILVLTTECYTKLLECPDTFNVIKLFIRNLSNNVYEHRSPFMLQNTI
jgi:hypothetical protein